MWILFLVKTISRLTVSSSARVVNSTAGMPITFMTQHRKWNNFTAGQSNKEVKLKEKQEEKLRKQKAKISSNVIYFTRICRHLFEPKKKNIWPIRKKLKQRKIQKTENRRSLQAKYNSKYWVPSSKSIEYFIISFTVELP